jgi:hypothetical protein
MSSIVDAPRARRERPRGCTAEQRDKLPSFQLIEEHSVPYLGRAGLQDIEVAANSQRVSEPLYNLLAVREGSRCLKPDSVIPVMSAA